MDSTPTSYEAERRSTRIRAQIPLRVTSLDPAAYFSEQCHTLVVNTQGCGVRLAHTAEIGLPVEIETMTGQKLAAQVANSVPLGADGKYWLVGLALEEPGNVWGLQPAPADWGEPRAFAAAAGAATTIDSTKKGEWPYSQFSSRGEFHPGRK